MGRRVCCSSFVPVALSVVAVLVAWPVSAADDAGVEFFEKNVRPVLVEHCYECHGPNKQEAGLQVDTVGGMLRGGDQGPSIVPGDPDASLLVKGLRYDDLDFQMPPKGKIAAEKIAAIEKWIKLGAAAPADEKRVTATTKKKFDLAERAKHWCFQPLAQTEPPMVRDAAWARTDVDRYILAKLEAAGLKPAAPADKRTLIRRAYFDFTGLPPKPAEVEAFVADASPEAFEKVVDRLLASPRFGERWARHWLDLVRYAESRGHEFDYQIPNAYQYRDYVIRAFNADVPYNRFVVEHLAGDLVHHAPRLNPETGANESILGTGFWFLGEECHSPVDIRQDETDRIDNKIDVMSKTFLGLTVACARCHDHKFDALTTKDYYAFSGFVRGMSYRQAPFEAMHQNRAVFERMLKLEAQWSDRLLDAQLELARPVAAEAERYLLATRDVLIERRKLGTKPYQRVIAAAVARRYGLDAARLAAWVDDCDSARDREHPLHAWRQFVLEGARPAADGSRLLNLVMPQPAIGISTIFDAGANRVLGTEFVDGVAFGIASTSLGGREVGTDAERPIVRYAERHEVRVDPKWNFYRNVEGNERDTTRTNWQQSGRTFKTETRVLETGKVWYLVRGSGRVYAAVDSHRVNNGPLHGQLIKTFAGPDKPTWVSHDLSRYVGERVHFEFTPLEAGEVKENQSDALAILKVVEADTPPAIEEWTWNFQAAKLATDTAPLSDDEFAKRYAVAFGSQFRALMNREKYFRDVGFVRAADLEAYEAQRTSTHTGPVRATAFAPELERVFPNLLAWVIDRPRLWNTPSAEVAARLAPFFEEQRKLFAEVKRFSRTAPTAWEGNEFDEQVLIRGNYRTPGGEATRGFLEAFRSEEHADSPLDRAGLAREVVAGRGQNLAARVIVNRLWQHLFGRGIVPTVDNFGVMGEAPTHPELLDHLAADFIADEWSMKRMLKKLALSNTYRMSSTPNAETAAKVATVDAENKLWHRALSKRLEAEAIRDSILAVSGSLDVKMYGPSVATFITPFMEGRGRPGSGPLDGAGRRSVYLSVRRNFLNPMFQAFDYPTPFTSVGRRSNSNVPAQALALMNGEFVRQQALLWAERSAKAESRDEAQRIERLYLTAYARKPTADESLAATEFLLEQRKAYDAKSSDDARPWADLCHVLFNVKEFIYLR